MTSKNISCYHLISWQNTDKHCQNHPTFIQIHPKIFTKIIQISKIHPKSFTKIIQIHANSPKNSKSSPKSTSRRPADVAEGFWPRHRRTRAFECSTFQAQLSWKAKKNGLSRWSAQLLTIWYTYFIHYIHIIYHYKLYVYYMLWTVFSILNIHEC